MYVFQSHMYLHIPNKSFEREKSLGPTVLLSLCLLFQQGNFSRVPFKTFSENFHQHYLASDILILSLNLFKKIVLASHSQSKPNGQKGFFTLLQLFFYSLQKYSQRLYFNHIMLINICKTQILFKCCNLIYLVNFVSIYLGEQRVGEKTKCRVSMIGEKESNKPFIKSFM